MGFRHLRMALKRQDLVASPHALHFTGLTACVDVNTFWDCHDVISVSFLDIDLFLFLQLWTHRLTHEWEWIKFVIESNKLRVVEPFLVLFCLTTHSLSYNLVAIASTQNFTRRGREDFTQPWLKEESPVVGLVAGSGRSSYQHSSYFAHVLWVRQVFRYGTENAPSVCIIEQTPQVL